VVHFCNPSTLEAEMLSEEEEDEEEEKKRKKCINFKLKEGKK
jgi:hypothetical protein